MKVDVGLDEASPTRSNVLANSKREDQNLPNT
jgi:hypothetical protein